MLTIRRLNQGGGIFEDIVSEKMVLLIGLPCNIAAVIAILQNKEICHDNLITIDLVCGGVTSSEVGKQYVEYLEKKAKSNVVDFSVRYKNPNWTPPYLHAFFSNGKTYCKEFYETEYGYAFEHMKRESCYSCRFKGDKHLSDITIGDAWGLESNDLGYNNLGVSVAFVHTEAGDRLLRELKDVVLFETDPKKMKQSNPRYLTPKQRQSQSKRFTLDFTKYGLIKSCKKAYSVKKRVIDAMPSCILKFIKEIKRIMRK